MNKLQLSNFYICIEFSTRIFRPYTIKNKSGLHETITHTTCHYYIDVQTRYLAGPGNSCPSRLRFSAGGYSSWNDRYRHLPIQNRWYKPAGHHPYPTGFLKEE